METKRIVMTSTFYPPFHLGGDATHVKMLRQELQKQGHEVHVLHSLDAYLLKRGGQLPQALSDPEVHKIHSSLGKWSARGAYLTGRNGRAERELERIVVEVKPDWIHHHNVSLLGAGLLRDWGVPNVYTAHDYWLACPRSDLMYLGKTTCQERRCSFCSLATKRPPQVWRSWKGKSMLRALDQVIAPSRFMATELAHFLDIEATVMPNFAPRPPKHPGPEANEPYFSFVGVLESNKGLDIVLEAFSRKEVTARLHVMGRGNLEALVRRAEKVTEGRISYRGFMTGQPLWTEIANSAAMLTPSTGNENSPLACIEALSMGVPLIVSGRGGLPELVEDPECGLVCELDPVSIARSVSIMMDDPNLVKRLSENAFIRYERHHTPELYLKSYFSLCEKVNN